MIALCNLKERICEHYTKIEHVKGLLGHANNASIVMTFMRTNALIHDIFTSQDLNL